MVERKKMDYAEIADAYEKIEATTKRLEMTDYLLACLEDAKRSHIKVVYFTQGKLYPDFWASKLALRNSP